MQNPGRVHERGFTLVELLVVLVLIGLLMAILVPNIRQTFQNYKEAQLQENIEKIMRGLVYQAFLNKRPFKLDQDAEKLILPEGFSVDPESTLNIRADGLCSGGRIRVQSADKEFTYNFAPPLCKPELIEPVS